MKRALAVVLALWTLGLVALANPTIQDFPRTLINARYVYVTSYDGDQFNPDLWPMDREAIANVQAAVQKWGHYALAYRPQDADIILVVQSRPSEDVLAVYDAKLWPQQNYLWRAMGREGLQKGETPLVTQLQTAFEKANASK